MSLAFPRVRSAKGPPVRWFDHIGDSHSPFVNAPFGARSYIKHETRLAYERWDRASRPARRVSPESGQEHPLLSAMSIGRAIVPVQAGVKPLMERSAAAGNTPRFHPGQGKQTFDRCRLPSYICFDGQ